MSRLEKMFEYVQHYTRSDGSIPLFGDADDGRLFRVIAGEDMNDHRHTLSVGAILFERSDFALSAVRFSQDALWLWGGGGFETYQRLRGGNSTSNLISRAFADGGFYIMRNENTHLMVDAGDIGMKGWGGHGHNDIFSFELWANGEPLIVDSGTYAYTFDVAARQQFRGIRAHNTVMVDGKEPARFVGLWMILRDRTRPRIVEWKPGDSSDVLEAQHHAYQSGFSQVIHRRRFEFDKKLVRLRITDMFEGRGRHSFESALHFAPMVGLQRLDASSFQAKGKNARYIIKATEGELKEAESWYSRSYGIRERNAALKVVVQATLPFRMSLDIQQS